ncbi:MAG: hypothetical protein Q4C78_06475 [Synergistaceae bacterium]|nr:hypothetical protein [Synergistaceae bacterium]
MSTDFVSSVSEDVPRSFLITTRLTFWVFFVFLTLFYIAEVL